jgi:hypothetical protein
MIDSQIQEYQELYLAVFGKEISYEQASIEARALLEVVKSIQLINS